MQTLVIENDKEIIEEYISSRSERSATAFVRKYQNFVYSTAFRFLHSYDDADDVAQEVFIKALNNLKKFRSDSNIKTWLYRITINTCSNMKRRKSFLSIFKSEDLDEFIDVKSEDFTPDIELENKQFEENFIKVLAELPEKQRETFALRYFDDMSYEEISKAVGTSVGGLKANYFQAVTKIAKLLKNDIG
jgi:RNA polymerase sigma-70 factor (ECF subfamily)